MMKKRFLILCVLPMLSYGLSLDDVKSGASEIENSIGNVNDIINRIGDYNLQDILQGATKDSELLGCLTQNINLGTISSIIPNTDGICGMVNSGFNLSEVLDNPIAKCVGVNIKKPKELAQMQNKFKNFCGNGNIGGDSSFPIFSSSTGNDGSTTPKKVYSSVAIVTTGIEVGSANGGVPTTSGEKELKNKKFISGLKVSDVYSGENGGEIYKKMKENPDSSEAMAIKTSDKNSLILKELALKLNGTTDETSISLPKDKLAVINDENDVANFVALGKVDYEELKGFLVTKAREAFAGIQSDTLSEYYIKENEAYQKMISDDEDVKKKIATVRENAIRAIGNRYEMELMKLKEDTNYVFNPSYTEERITKTEYKNEYKVKSLLQINKETAIKSDMAMEKRDVSMKIDKVVEQAYYMASIFRGDIAKKEIDDILKAVDTTIH